MIYPPVIVRQQSIILIFLVIFAYSILPVAFISWELFAVRDFKPSTMIGNFLGNEKAAHLMNELEAERAMVSMKNNENIRMEKEVASYKAELDRVTQAKAAINEHANSLAKIMAELQSQFLKLRQETLMKTHEGDFAVGRAASVLGVIGGLLGRPEIASGASALVETSRAEVMGDFDNAAQQGGVQIGKLSDELMNGADDPAKVVSNEHKHPVTPEPRNPLPQGSPFYRSANTMRLARVNSKFKAVLVRSEPRKAENAICSFTKGAIVALVADEGGGRINDPDNRIIFVHVRFNWQGHGEQIGWIGEKVLEEFSGTEQDTEAQQTCNPV